MLRPQDVLLCLKLGVSPEAFTTYASLGFELGIGESEAHRSAKRAAEARLLDPERRQVHRANLTEFLVYGVPYAFAVRRGPLTRGLPTGIGASPLREHFATTQPNELPVWPDENGTVRGCALDPLYPSVPEAARRDRQLYEVLALLDALREGRARERALATDLLIQRLTVHP